MKSIQRIAFIVVAVVVCCTPSLAQVSMKRIEALATPVDSSEGLKIASVQHFTTNSSPYFGPVEVQVHTEHPTVSRGSLNDVFFAVLNHSNEATVTVNIDLDLSYSDGQEVNPFHLGADRQQTLGPDEGYVFIIFWQVPADAPLGKATFRVEATVGRLTQPITENLPESSNPRVATDFVEFDVVP